MSPRIRSDEKARIILDAARRCLADRGYAATTVAEVAAEAEVSRGLLHYYFKNKEDMLARVVEATFEPLLDVLGPMLAASRSPEEIAAGLTTATRELIRNDPTVFNLVFECWVVARQSEMVMKEMAALFRRFRAVMEAGLLEAKSRGALGDRIPMDKLGMLVTALLDGLALQLTLDRELAADEEVWSTLEEAILRLVGSER